MAKQPLTPQEKANKERRKQLQYAHNQVLSAWNFREIDTWEGVYKKLGYSAQYTTTHPDALKGPAKYAEVKSFLDKQTKELEDEINRQVAVGTPQQPTPVPAPVPRVEQPPAPSRAEESLAKAVEQGIQDGEAAKLEAEIKQQKSAHKATEQPGSDKDYGFVRSPKEKCSFFWFQKKAIVEAWKKLMAGSPSVLILSGTGTGKTWMASGILRRFNDADFHVGKTMSHIPYLYVTRASVVNQTERVLERDFSLGVEDTSVINIEQLRSSAGKFWLKRELKIVNGEEEEQWTWKKHVQPAVIVWDECQALKNSGSLQHNIACALNELQGMFQPKQVFVSATPFTKVSEAKCWAVSTHKSLAYILGKRSGFPEDAVLTNETWPAYAKAIAYPNPPDEYNEAAVERLMLDLEDYVVRVKGVRPQFEAENHVELIDFQTRGEREYYNSAWERYLEQKAKLEAQGLAGVPVGMALLVQFLKFRMAAEFIRHKYLVERMVGIVEGGKAAVCFLSFKTTIIHMVLEFEKRGIHRDQISIIWGGGQTQLTDKQKRKAKIMSLSDNQLKAQGVTREELLENLELEDVEDREILELPDHLRLGMQSMEERDREMQKFQTGKTLYCIYTLRAGGVGLSLHHTDEWMKPEDRCRRKESGYVVEEDIPKIPTRPREVIGTPTWSPIELVQGVGRCPRLTSLSTTVQTLVFYRGTIEMRVADIANRGLRCLSKIVKHRESWSDLVIHGGPELDKYKEALPEDTEDTGLVDEEGEE